MEFTDQIQTVQNDSKHTNNRDPNEPPTICRSHHVEYAQINITVVPAKYSFAIQRAKQQIKSTGNQAANQDYCTFELLSVSIAQLVGQVLPVYLFRLLLLYLFSSGVLAFCVQKMLGLAENYKGKATDPEKKHGSRRHPLKGTKFILA